MDEAIILVHYCFVPVLECFTLLLAGIRAVGQTNGFSPMIFGATESPETAVTVRRLEGRLRWRTW